MASKDAVKGGLRNEPLYHHILIEQRMRLNGDSEVLLITDE